MKKIDRDDLFYVCGLIEYIARKTLNERSVVVNCLGEEGVRKQLKDASCNHCLSFEQVSDEVTEYYHIPNGTFDTITGCKYTIPGYQDIGRLYAYMILDCAKPGEEVQELIKLFNSYISNEISRFSTDLYYQNLSYLECSYKAGYLLD